MRTACYSPARMSDIVWGPPVDGVRVGLEQPAGELEAGGSVTIGLVAESVAREPVLLFGFAQRYPRVRRALGEPFVRRVALWNGEWRQGPASQLADLLDRLAAEG